MSDGLTSIQDIQVVDDEIPDKLSRALEISELMVKGLDSDEPTLSIMVSHQMHVSNIGNYLRFIQNTKPLIKPFLQNRLSKTKRFIESIQKLGTIRN